MGARTTAYVTTARMGAGKTYTRGPWFLVNEWIPYHQGLHVSNFPLNVDAIAEHCEKRHGIPAEETRARIHVIPTEIKDRWCKELAQGEVPEGPWSYFKDEGLDLSGAHIAIDEAQLFMPRGDRSQLARRKMWREWLSELRHDGASAEFLTQSEKSIDDRVIDLCDLRLEIVSRVSDRDPFFRIPMGDWYELKGKITGEWNPVIYQRELRQVTGGWECIDEKLVELSGEYYRLYNSWSQAQSNKTGGLGGNHVDRHEFEARSWPSLLWWFFRRNWWAFTSRLLVVVGFLWLCFFGGIPLVMGFLVNFLGDMAGSQAKTVQAWEDETAGVSVEHRPVEDEGEGEEQGDVVQPDGFTYPLDTVLYEAETEDGGFLVYRLEDLEYLLEDRAWLETAVEVQKRELAELREEGDQIVVLTMKYVVFESGVKVPLGGQITGSGYDGKRLQAINYRERQAILDDGTILSLRVPDVDTSAGFGGLSGGDFLSTGKSAGSNPGSPSRGTDNAGGHGNTSGAIPPPSQQ